MSRYLAPGSLLLPALLCACGAGAPSDRPPETRSAVSVGPRTGSTGADTGRVVPLRPMDGDVEVLFGDPEEVGEPFVMRIRELPGTRIPVHSHPVDEHITVVQGTWYFALGERWDSTALRELTAGSYAFAPAGRSMFGYSPDGAVVQVHGVGPFHIHWQDGSATLDDVGSPNPFRFRKGERVRSARGTGTVRQGYGSGSIVQYEVETDAGRLLMVDERDLGREEGPPE